MNLPAAPLAHFPVWLDELPVRLALPTARLDEPTVWPNHSAARPRLPTIRSGRFAIRQDQPAAPPDHSAIRQRCLTARLDEPTAPENHSTVRQNHSTAPKNPPAARFFGKNTPKPSKITHFPRPTPPTGQKATVCQPARVGRVTPCAPLTTGHLPTTEALPRSRRAEDCPPYLVKADDNTNKKQFLEIPGRPGLQQNTT